MGHDAALKQIAGVMKTLNAILEQAAVAEPSVIAYQQVLPGQPIEVLLTYAQLAERSLALADHLRAVVGHGKPIAIWLPTGAEFIVAFYGVIASGNYAVPLPSPSSIGASTRLSSVVANLQPAAVITDDPTRKALQLAPDELSFLRSLRLVDVAEAMTAGRSQSLVAVDPDDVAVIQYTSGSTSSPKGVMVTHRNLVGNAQLLGRVGKLAPRDNVVCWLPQFHDMGLMSGTILPLVLGTTTTLIRPAHFLSHPAVWLQAISACRARASAAPNFAYDLCVSKVKVADLEGIDLGCWDLAIWGSERNRADTVARFAERFAPVGFRREAILPSYGLAEATLMVTGGPAGGGARLSTDRGEPAIVSCGRLHAEQHVVIVDPATRAPLPPGEVGEIWIEGPHVGIGYWRAAAATEATFQARLSGDGSPPYLRTGDLGFIDGEELFVSGRLKDLIIVRGQNHHPEDLEATADRALRAYDGDAQSVAFGAIHRDEEGLVLVVEGNFSLRALAPQLFARLRRDLAEFHGIAPRSILLVRRGQIRRTSSGKKMRADQKAQYLDGTLRFLLRDDLDPLRMDGGTRRQRPDLAVRYEHPTSEFEAQVTSIFADVLNLDRVGIDDNFFELGGDSLRATQALALLASAGSTIQLEAFFELPTPRYLATTLKAQTWEVIDI